MGHGRGKGGRRRSEGPRSGTGGIQPELAGKAPARYWKKSEAQRYHSKQGAQLQAELTQSAYVLGNLPSSCGVVLDLGAGGGMSSISLQALAAAEATDRGPPFVIAMDASLDMLRQTPSEADLTGVRVTAPRAVEESDVIEVADGLRWWGSRSDSVLADMSQPLPFRAGVVDAVLSISAVQWLFDVRPSETQDEASEGVSSAAAPPPQPRLMQLFRSLHSVCTEEAPLALQFYPTKGDLDYASRNLRHTALQAGFEANIIMDYPHKGKPSKKYLLSARRRKHNEVSIDTPSAWCALCWPVVCAGCALQFTPAIEGDAKPGTAAAGRKFTLARVWQQHLEAGLRLARSGRRLQPSNGDPQIEAIQHRIRQQLHPLQYELAAKLGPMMMMTMDSAAAEEAGAKPSLADAEDDASVQKKPRLAAPQEPTAAEAPAEGGVSEPTAQQQPTKTELRCRVVERMAEVLAVLHTPPDVKWTLPPPPLMTDQELEL